MPIFLTEDKERVLKALANVIDLEYADCREESGPEEDYQIYRCFSSTFKSLEKLRFLLRVQRILDAARTYLERGRENDEVKFYLNKQAALTGKVSFCTFEFGESPLGAITVTVRLGECDPEKFMNWLAPRTLQGRPVKEEEEPC